jgi:hypothetical protein
MRRMTVRAGLLAAGLASLAAAAGAQTPTGETAAPLLFAPAGVEVEVLPQSFLAADQAAVLAQVAAGQPYYGAVALSPDEGLMSEATVAAANHHSTEAATAAALAGCDAKRRGATPCVIAALIRPKGWAPRGFQLSSGATAAVFDDYARVRRDKALAVSPATGLWGIGKGRGAAEKALADCAGKGQGVTDCAVVLVD